VEVDSEKASIEDSRIETMTICHYPGTTSGVTMIVTLKEAEKHGAHGDVKGSCANQ
jgi:hypothetical protein